MENKKASVCAVPAQKKKEAVEEEEIQEEDYASRRNEVIFCLREDIDYRIRAQIEWCENSKREIIGEPSDIYFMNVFTGQSCENPRACVTNIIGRNEYSAERWETLCMRIHTIPLSDLREIVRNEKRHML